MQFATLTADERTALDTILDRVESLFAAHHVPFDRIEISMDLLATHSHLPLDFVRLAAFDDFNLLHDITGINRHMNRRTGRLSPLFLPRCVRPTAKSPLRFTNMLTGQSVVATDWQAALHVGDCYVIEQDDLTIYGEITEATDDAGFFWARGYSLVCPDGELGLLCVADATRQITRAEFDAAITELTRAAGETGLF